MRRARVGIVGGGLSGLYAAYLLQAHGIDYVLLEARNRLGGRILSVSPDGIGVAPETITNRFDLGPSWFWPEFQPQLDALINSLGLKRFEQPGQGDAFIERAVDSLPVRVPSFHSAPSSFRLLGGMSALVDALVESLDPAKLIVGTPVRHMKIDGSCVIIECQSGDDEVQHWAVEHVLLAVPPRIAAQNLIFEPMLPNEIIQSWRATATWMAPHAKYVAVYEADFWSGEGLSGQARSTVGPMVEMHDASVPGGHAALFGFLGVTAQARKRLSLQQIKAMCRDQLVRIFGPQAGTPTAEFLQDWSTELFTATAEDLFVGDHHPMRLEAEVKFAPWAGRLRCIASEWSHQFPGYLAGAVETTEKAVFEVVGGQNKLNTGITS
ncbi:flavin monoamine oxidase family protein [Pseudomonas sp. KnCO4]|uniref:flavin monoamine oxidase family protein n=1 Tax=Pseudomonas sp. KnCO4 TaxID=3381355 RepID=UPI0038781422